MELAIEDKKKINEPFVEKYLILWNLPEETTEKSWDQTKKRLSELLDSYLNRETRRVANMIEPPWLSHNVE